LSERGLRLSMVAAVTALAPACHDVSSFSTVSGGSYEGPIVGASFVRAGLSASARVCLTIDTAHLQDSPGTISSNDGLFYQTPLRSIPQLWQDPLSTLTFGEGRIQNVIYVARGNALDGGASREGGASGEAGDVFVVVSFMVAGNIEARLLRGAPPAPDSGPAPAGPPNLFGVFVLNRADAACPY
jgi:hypothetical protein